MMRTTILTMLLTTVLGQSAFAENAAGDTQYLLIGEVHSPETAKGPSGSVVWTNDFGFLVKHSLKEEPEYFVYNQKPSAIHYTRSFDEFIVLLDQLPGGVSVDWIKTCGTPIDIGMPAEHIQRLENVLKDNHLTLLKPRTGICRCGSTNTTWYTEAKGAAANPPETPCTVPVIRVLAATYECPGPTSAENEKYAIALEEQVAGISGVEKVCSEVTDSEVKIYITLAKNADDEMALKQFSSALQQFSNTDSDQQQLITLWGKGAAPGGTLDEKERRQVEDRFAAFLPSEQYIGAGKEWTLKYHDSEEEDVLSVVLKQKGGTSSDQCMWFHILYKPDGDDSYGYEDFGDYRGMGAKGVHYFIKVGNVEIRAVADSDEYKNDEAIKGMLNAFKLKDIETL